MVQFTIDYLLFTNKKSGYRIIFKKDRAQRALFLLVDSK